MFKNINQIIKLRKLIKIFINQDRYPKNQGLLHLIIKIQNYPYQKVKIKKTFKKNLI